MGEGTKQDYELVMATDEQIDFISDEIIAGNLGADGTGVGLIAIDIDTHTHTHIYIYIFFFF